VLERVPTIAPARRAQKAGNSPRRGRRRVLPWFDRLEVSIARIFLEGPLRLTLACSRPDSLPPPPAERAHLCVCWMRSFS